MSHRANLIETADAGGISANLAIHCAPMPQLPTPQPRTSALALALLASLAVLLAACDSSPPKPGPEQRPELRGAATGWNVVLLSIDTLRADHLGAYGYQVRETSPNLDQLMAGGVRFEQANAPRALTWPSLATVLTGLYPSGHGVIDNGYELPADLPTLPLALHTGGYRTGAFLGNMCRANHQGWDAFECNAGQDGKSVAAALEWLGQQQGEQPFFLWVHLFGAHGPYYNGGDLAATQLDPGYQGTLEPKKWRLNAVMSNREQLSERDIVHLHAIYDAAVIGSDRIAGRLLDGLRESGQLERTLVVLLADHGEELYQHHGYLYHACSVYQSALHVPLAMAAPGLLRAGATVSQTVELGDVTPTILDLVGLPALPESHGVSLVPYLQRPEVHGRGRPAFSEYGQERIHTVLQGEWKLVDNPESVTPVCSAESPEDLYPIANAELYDLSQDPLEQHNLAEQNPGKVAELRELIRNRFANLARRDVPQELPEELKQELRSLGYVAP